MKGTNMCLCQLTTALLSLYFVLSVAGASDVMVQLHVNRPFNDVSEKFVSFAIKPEDLYKALDGANRKSFTLMAVMLGDSYIKFLGDFYFVSSSEGKLRNPTKIMWKGFNRWTRAVNWTMIIPVPYTPNSWDPMQALRILNTSHSVGITDCIWQLGTDFSSSRAQDYVEELKTLGLMVDSFGPYVDDWKIMGADVSAGSSVDETRRYIELSQDLNEAFGWTQPAERTPTNRIASYIQDSDPALKMLLSKNVPVWLSLPQKSIKSKSKRNSNNLVDAEKDHAFRWATTLGEAASTGFDAIFKRINPADLEHPSFSFYVTALFKKVMGSRVFPARPLNIFAKSNKLYTHCANDVSGGIAFMVVNSDERTLQISVRSMTKLAGTELWQYSLSMDEGVVMLNDERLTLNTTLTPQIKEKHQDKPVQLSTPGMSVSFWVFPNVDLEHCQFTEIEAGEVTSSESEEHIVQKRYSSHDRLLQQLIQESTLANSPLARNINRKRRYATFADRAKRFILENPASATTSEFGAGLKKLFEPAALDEEKTLEKREDSLTDTMREATLGWLKPVLAQEKTLNKREEDSLMQTMREAALSWLKPALAEQKTLNKREEESLMQTLREAALRWLQPFAPEKALKKREDENPLQAMRDGALSWFQPLVQDMALKKRADESLPPTMREAALSWLSQFLPSGMQAELPLLKRDTRSIDDDYFRPYFGTKDGGKKTAFTRKITEIRKPEKKIKPVFDIEHFDEEAYFKKISEHQESDYVRFPEGDVHLKHIQNVEGDDIEDVQMDKKRLTGKAENKETVSEMKRLLPTEFFEALPTNGYKSKDNAMEHKMSFGTALNSMLFPEPFSKKANKHKFGRDKQHAEQEPAQEEDVDSAVETMGRGHSTKGTELAQEFLKAQRELSRAYLNDDNDKQSEEQLSNTHKQEQQDEEKDKVDRLPERLKRKYLDYLAENMDNYFGDRHAEPKVEAEEQDSGDMERSEDKSKEVPWWEMSSMRKKRSTRALKFPQLSDDAWQSNMITKEDDLRPLGIVDTEDFQQYEYKVEVSTEKNDVETNKSESMPQILVKKVKEKVSKFMDIVGRHMSDWYHTFTKHIEGDVEITEVKARDMNKNQK